MPAYFDIAVNLVGSALEHEIDTVIEDAAKLRVSPLLVIGSDLAESTKALALTQAHPHRLYCTAGVHPHQASSWNDASSAELTQLCAAAQVVALGECGLDYNRDFSPRPVQRRVFAAQLELAAKLKMPVFMHERDANRDFIAIVKEYRPHLPNALLHCFTGDRAMLDACLALDLHLGITGWVCDERRGQELAALVPDIPDDRIMIETDSPYLLPRNLRPKPKSSKNKPEYLPHISEHIAGLRGQDPSQFAALCYHNSLRFFGLEHDHVGT
ncbi:TatD family hydrolase [Shewanella sp. AS16]|uniref:TatD family hydrolase n=1 Tax=Shewanella sp. AS16 TaxID=2907625 RepID=UPI001F2C475A|nr:TatD family hydrolase [Shewanella sp. AS16]MCE9685950.1 TatD family hydrolase [Shewanella sp. AS16]